VVNNGIKHRVNCSNILAEAASDYANWAVSYLQFRLYSPGRIAGYCSRSSLITIAWLCVALFCLLGILRATEVLIITSALPAE
jgi:hypothetical protein